MLQTPTSRRGRGALAVAAFLLAPPLAVLGQPSRTPVFESVDLLVPTAPTMVRIAGTTYVVHELHITNFVRVEVSITRVQVDSFEPSRFTLADHRGSELVARLGRPGLQRNASDPHLLGPGMRAVVYLWLAVPEGSALPRAVVHRVELDLLRPSGRQATAVEGAIARVTDDAPSVLGPPLRGGPWVAIYDPQLVGGHRTAIYTVGGRARIPARFAIDWIRLPPGGAIEVDAASRPADWNGYGAEVLAVADGVVSAALDDLAEEPPPPASLESASGNYVTLDLGSGRFAFYEHLKPRSLTVRFGDRVRRGQVIGRLGRSGSTSIGPHLHFHMADANDLLAADGLPFVFESFDELGAFRSLDALIAGERWIESRPEDREHGSGFRKLERPAPNAVVRFP